MKSYDVSLVFIVKGQEKLLRLKTFFENNELVEFSDRPLDDEEVFLVRIEPYEYDETSIVEQISIIKGAASSGSIVESSDIFEKVYIDVVVYYTTYTCSVDLSAKLMGYCMSIYQNISVKITCYPSDEEE